MAMRRTPKPVISSPRAVRGALSVGCPGPPPYQAALVVSTVALVPVVVALYSKAASDAVEVYKN